MKKRRLYILGFALLLLMAVQTRGQERFEITPFVGYETSGSYPVNPPSSIGGNLPPVNSLRVNEALAFGTFLDYSISEHHQLEFLWNRNNTSYSARSILTNQYHKAFNSTVDQFQFGGLFLFLGREHKLRPYIAGGLGSCPAFWAIWRIGSSRARFRMFTPVASSSCSLSFSKTGMHRNYCNFAYSALVSFRMGMSGSKTFQRSRNCA